MECPTLPFVLGVQWHPEELAKTDQHSADIFSQFVQASAGDWRTDVPHDWRERFVSTVQSYAAEPVSVEPALQSIGSSADMATVAQL